MERLLGQQTKENRFKSELIELSGPEILAGVELSHVMLKPEALDELDKDPEIRAAVLEKLFQALSLLELNVIWTGRGTLSESVFQQIYQQEISKGIIHDNEILRLSESDTFHMIVKGVDAVKKTHKIKGRFCCDHITCPHCSIQINDVNLESVFNDKNIKSNSWWGSGCGIRGFLARSGIVKPDEGTDYFTVYNWVHSPDPDQHYAVSAVVDAVNNGSLK